MLILYTEQQILVQPQVESEYGSQCSLLRLYMV